MGQRFKNNIRKAGQIKREKMRLSIFMEQVDNNPAINPFLKELLETSFILQTTDITAIANHLKYSPATIRAGFEQIFEILGKSGKQHIFQIIKNQTQRDKRY